MTLCTHAHGAQLRVITEENIVVDDLANKIECAALQTLTTAACVSWLRALTR
jgi:hypothetical protein